jgi:hypothetical protein
MVERITMANGLHVSDEEKIISFFFVLDEEAK